MRILISNPDTIGDVLLRQPLFAALAGAGHELMLVVRPMLAPIMGMISPGARIEACDLPVYDPRLGVGAPELEPLAAAAAGFDPDVFVIAPYQWTVLEERLAAAVPRARCIAMSGLRYGDPHYGAPVRSRIQPTVLVDVARDLPELRKNERIASAVLGKSVSLPDPVLQPGEGGLRLAEAALTRLGLPPEGYWVACVGDAPHSAVRNWGAENWGGLLGRWAREHGEKFLFVGLASEARTVAQVREAMGDAGQSAREWSGREGGDLETLVGLVAHARGYIGRDTGPMHIAAALDKPVAAVFGGGTWPRFIPAGKRSIAVTVGVPCTGCEWRCHLAESYCIKRVPVDAVWKAVEEVRSGKVREPRARVIAPEAELLIRIGREGAESAQVRLIQASMARRELAEERKSMSQNGAPTDGAVETLYGPEPKPGAFRESRESRETKREESTAQLAQLQARLTEQARVRGEQQGTIESLREQLAETKARVRDLDNRMERRLAELFTATAESASAKEKNAQLERQLASAKREADQGRQQSDALNDSVRKAQIELQQARAEVQQVRAELLQARQAAQAAAAQAQTHEQAIGKLEARLVEVKGGLSALQAERDRLAAELAGMREERDAAVRKLGEGGGPTGRLATTQKALGQAQADVHDLRTRLKRVEADRAAVANLSRQHEGRIAELQSHLDDLLRSRWRKYGQKFGLAMTMPWEEEMRNGRA